jgi:hypothetical protein
MSEPNKSLTSSPQAVAEKTKNTVGIPPGIIETPEIKSLLNQKEQDMTKILQDAQEARNNLKAETPKTPDSKLVA